MRLRVCILAEATPFTWVSHYVAAFREKCDVITVGSTFKIELLGKWGSPQLADIVKPNDIEVDLDKIEDLEEILPDGWSPHLVVAIASGGMPVFRNTMKLSCPTVFIAIDTLQCLPDYSDALYYDFVFEAQKECVEYLQATGSSNVFWLPLACSPAIHHPVEIKKEYDIAFIGATKAHVHGERKILLELLKSKFSVLHAQDIHSEEISELFCRGKIAFNCSGINDVNMRIFEVMAMGCVLLTNRDSEHNGLFKLFEDGKHLVTYDSAEDLIAKAEALLGDDDKRDSISEEAYKEICSKHTYGHRVDSILETVQRFIPAIDEFIAKKNHVGTPIIKFFPGVPGTVVDFGLFSGVSKYAARQIGAIRFIGIADDADHADAYKQSYDEIRFLPLDGLQADTAIIADTSKSFSCIGKTITIAYEVLHRGATLILVLSNSCITEGGLVPEYDCLVDWLREKNFVVIHGRIFKTDNCTVGNGACLIVARKRTQSITDVAKEIIADQPIIGEAFYSEDYLKNLPQGT